MQPDNRQGQSPNNTPPANGEYVSTSSANIPEYLHMEPVADSIDASQKRRKKKFLLLLIAILLIVLIVGAALVYWYVQQSKPQQRLYRALENALSVKYVNKKTAYHKDGTGKGINVKTDSVVNLSNPSSILSESKIDFSRQIKRDGVVVDDNYLVRLVKLTKLNLYAESYSGKTDLNGLDKKRWVESTPTKGTIDSRLEEFDVSTVIYGSQPVPAMGNYSDTLRRKIMDTIKSENMYEVLDTSSKNVGGKSLTGMRIIVDRDAINKLNKMIATEAKLEVTHNLLKLVNSANYEDIMLWVDDKDTIVGVDYRNGLDKDHIRISNKMEFTYLHKANIDEPTK